MNGVPVASTIHTGKDATIYRYHWYGLLDDVPHNRQMHGAIIAQNEDWRQVKGSHGSRLPILILMCSMFCIGRKSLTAIY